MNKRWSNAAQFVSLTHGWPEYDYPAYAAVELALACASAAPPAVCPARASGCPHSAFPCARVGRIAARVTLGEREQVNAAYAKYKAAFDEALQAAHNDYHLPTPEKVKALAKPVKASAHG